MLVSMQVVGCLELILKGGSMQDETNGEEDLDLVDWTEKGNTRIKDNVATLETKIW